MARATAATARLSSRAGMPTCVTMPFSGFLPPRSSHRRRSCFVPHLLERERERERERGGSKPAAVFDGAPTKRRPLPQCQTQSAAFGAFRSLSKQSVLSLSRTICYRKTPRAAERPPAATCPSSSPSSPFRCILYLSTKTPVPPRKLLSVREITLRRCLGGAIRFHYSGTQISKFDWNMPRYC